MHDSITRFLIASDYYSARVDLPVILKKIIPLAEVISVQNFKNALEYADTQKNRHGHT